MEEAQNLSTLPTEVLVTLFQQVPFYDAGALCLVSKTLAKVGHGNEVWRRRFEAAFPDLLSSRLEQTEVLKARSTIPVHLEWNHPLLSTPQLCNIAADGVDEAQVRLSWREIFFVTRRLSAVLNVYNSAVDAINLHQKKAKRPAVRRKNAPPPPPPLEKMDLQLDVLFILRLVAQVNDLIRNICESDVELDDDEEDNDEADNQNEHEFGASFSVAKFDRRDQVAHIGTRLREQLIYHHVHACLELLLQLVRRFPQWMQPLQQPEPQAQQHFQLYCRPLELCVASKYQKVLLDDTSSLLRQMSRIIDTFYHPSIPSTPDILGSVSKRIFPHRSSMLESPLNAFLDWCQEIPLGLTKSIAKNQRGFYYLLRACAQAALIELDEFGWSGLFSEQQHDRQVNEDVSTPDTTTDTTALTYSIFNDAIDVSCVNASNPSHVWMCVKQIIEFDLPKLVKQANLPSWRLSAGKCNVLHLTTEAMSQGLSILDIHYIASLCESALKDYDSMHWIARRAAGFVLAQMADDLTDKIEPALPYILQILATSITNDPDRRVVEYSRDCLVNIFSSSEGKSQHLFVAYADGLIPNALATVVERKGEWSQAVVFLASTAESLGLAFASHYGSIMDVLRSVISSPDVSELAMKRTIVSASVILNNAKKFDSAPGIQERFSDDLNFIVQAIYRLYNIGAVKAGDRSITLSLLRCAVAQEIASPGIIEFALPKLFETLSAPAAVRIDAAADEVEGWQQYQINNHVFSVDRVDLDRRTTAAESLVTYVQKCSIPVFQRFMREVQTVVIEMIRFVYLSDVSIGAADVLVEIFNHYATLHKEGVLSAAQRSEMEAYAQTSIVELSNRVGTLSDMSTPGVVFESLTTIVSTLRELEVNNLPLHDIISSVLDMIQSAAESSTELRENVRGADDDDEERPTEVVQEEEKQFEELTQDHRFSVMSAIELEEAMCESYGSQALDLLLSHLDRWTSDEIIGDVIGAQFALCTTTVILENCSSAESLDLIRPHVERLVRLLLDGCQSPSPYVIQPAVYGLGRACKALGLSAFSRYLVEASESLIGVSEYEAMADENRFESVADNVGAASARILVQISSDPTTIDGLEINQARLAELFVENFPPTRDTSELLEAVDNFSFLHSTKNEHFMAAFTNDYDNVVQRITDALSMFASGGPSQDAQFERAIKSVMMQVAPHIAEKFSSPSTDVFKFGGM